MNGTQFCRLRFLAVCFAIMGGGLFAAVDAHAADYPSQPITLIVGSRPGGTQDTLARIVADQFKRRMGQPVIVENRPGAATLIAQRAVAEAAPDGYTLLVKGSQDNIGKLLYKSFTLDPIGELSHIGLLESGDILIASGASAPFKSLKEFIAYGKANPGKLNWGAPSPSSQLDGAIFFSEFGLEQVTIVNYPGTGPLLKAFLSGEVQVGLTTMTSIKPHVEAGTIRVLAVQSDKRSAVLPDVPALGELAPNIAWPRQSVGVSGPKGLPPAIIAKLNAELNAILKDPDVVNKLETIGVEAGGGDPARWKNIQESQMTLYTKAAKLLKMEPQ